MEFSRHYQFRVDIIGETLSLSTLHYVLSLLGRHYENMKMQKRELTAKHSSQRYGVSLCLCICVCLCIFVCSVCVCLCDIVSVALFPCLTHMIVLTLLQVTLCHSGIQGVTGVCPVHGRV